MNFCSNVHLNIITAIVGAGVGGTSAAYFLRELFGNNVDIDIFEKGQVGGRLALLKMGEHYYNAGGTIIHPQNMYMVNFTDILGKAVFSQCFQVTSSLRVRYMVSTI